VPSFPQPFGPYILDRFVAAGGMAEVFVARREDGAIPRDVRLCVKRILPDVSTSTEYVTMFRDEAALTMRLVHKNIVRVFDTGEIDGRLYMAMEYVDGMDLGTLQRRLAQRNLMLGVHEALKIGIDLCNALYYAHTMLDDRRRPLKLIHRDVSPQNVMLSQNGDVKLGDFGIAKSIGRETKTSTGLIKGKVQYMAPEQALGHFIDQRIDQFAAGIVMWEMLTGQRLYADKSELVVFEKIIRQIPAKPSTIREGIPPSLDQAVARALAKNPDERFPDMNAFGLALATSLAQLGGPQHADVAGAIRSVMSGQPAPPRPSIEVSAPSSPPPMMTSQSSVFESSGPKSASGLSVTMPARTPSASAVVPMKSTTMPSITRSTAAQTPAPASSGVPVIPLMAALAVGVLVGFGVAKLVLKPASTSSSAAAMCGAPNPAFAMQAADDLISAQEAINAGDRARAEQIALRANQRSASVKGHYILGQLRMKEGDTLTAMQHYHCVVMLGPSSDEARALGERLSPR
jgi:eukaryotic-like serine/threonine-protein kinase